MFLVSLTTHLKTLFFNSFVKARSFLKYPWDFFTNPNVNKPTQKSSILNCALFMKLWGVEPILLELKPSIPCSTTISARVWAYIHKMLLLSYPPNILWINPGPRYPRNFSGINFHRALTDSPSPSLCQFSLVR